jgi:predicted ATP-grasp superfamily ATP-dependent carboligase
MLDVKFENPVLILGGHQIGLWVAREFGKRNIEIYIVGDNKNNIAFKSKYCKRRIVVPRPWDCQKLVKILKNMAKITTKRLVVYALNDMDILSLSMIKGELRDDFYFVVSEREATETLVNKRKFYQALDENNIEHPKTFFPRDLENAKYLGKNMSYPVFIRPSITELFIRVFGYRKGFVANSYGELLKYYHSATSKKVEVMFQEIIPGSPYNSLQLEGYFNKNFCPTGLFARQRLRIWPLNFGNTTLCVSVSLSKFTLETKKITDFLKNIRYNGLASAEFKKDARDGIYKLLEINARPWLHFWLSAKCGINILFSSYLDAIGEKVEYNQGYIAGFKSLNFWDDLSAFIKMTLKGELTFREWLSSLKGVKRLTLFDEHDALPFFATLPRCLKNALTNAFWTENN